MQTREQLTTKTSIEGNRMKKMHIWISYDLSINSDYDGMYKWLDDNNAVECGDSFAFIPAFQYKEDLRAEFLKEIKKNVKLRAKDRIYLISMLDGKSVGRFIHGKRKDSPWVGYGSNAEETLDGEE